jgi:hypothetical protein
MSSSTFEFNSKIAVRFVCVLVCVFGARAKALQYSTPIQSTTSTSISRDRTGYTQRSRHAERSIWNCLDLSRVAFEFRETPQIFHCKSKLPEPRPERVGMESISLNPSKNASAQILGPQRSITSLIMLRPKQSHDTADGGIRLI